MASSKKPKISWGDKGDDLVRIIRKAITQGTIKKQTQAKRVSKKAAQQMSRQGKPERAKQVRSNLASAKKFRTEMDALNRKATYKELENRLVKQADKTLGARTLAESVESKGTKLRRGKEVPVGKENAAGIKKQAGFAESQRKKGWDKERAIQQKLSDEIKAATDMATRRQLKNKLRDRREKYGDFLAK